MVDKRRKLVIEKPTPIRKIVYEHLRDEILDGFIPPLSRLVEAQIAQNLGTSRTPVREALHLLEREGLVESIARVGYCVRDITWDELEEICEIRIQNEILASRWALKRISELEIQALDKNLAEAESILAKGHFDSFIKNDEEFHEILIRAGGSLRLLDFCQQLHRHMLRYRVQSLHTPEPIRIAIEGHKRILLCLKERDAEAIESAVVEHLRYSKENIRKYVLNRGKGEKTGGCDCPSSPQAAQDQKG